MAMTKSGVENRGQASVVDKAGRCSADGHRSLRLATCRYHQPQPARTRRRRAFSMKQSVDRNHKERAKRWLFYRADALQGLHHSQRGVMKFAKKFMDNLQSPSGSQSQSLFWLSFLVVRSLALRSLTIQRFFAGGRRPCAVVGSHNLYDTDLSSAYPPRHDVCRRGQRARKPRSTPWLPLSFLWSFGIANQTSWNRSPYGLSQQDLDVCQRLGAGLRRTRPGCRSAAFPQRGP